MAPQKPTARIDCHMRLPVDLHAILQQEADRLGVSLNAMIVLALRSWAEE